MKTLIIAFVFIIISLSSSQEQATREWIPYYFEGINIWAFDSTGWTAIRDSKTIKANKEIVLPCWPLRKDLIRIYAEQNSRVKRPCNIFWKCWNILIDDYVENSKHIGWKYSWRVDRDRTVIFDWDGKCMRIVLHGAQGHINFIFLFFNNKLFQ